MSEAPAPAKKSRIVPFVDDEELVDWDFRLDKLPPAAERGSFVAHLVPRAAIRISDELSED